MRQIACLLYAAEEVKAIKFQVSGLLPKGNACVAPADLVALVDELNVAIAPVKARWKKHFVDEAHKRLLDLLDAECKSPKGT